MELENIILGVVTQIQKDIAAICYIKLSFKIPSGCVNEMKMSVQFHLYISHKVQDNYTNYNKSEEAK